MIKELLKQFPLINEEELKSLIKVKESEINFSKITTHDNIDVVVYFIDKIPYFFKIDKDEHFIPTGKIIHKISSHTKIIILNFKFISYGSFHTFYQNFTRIKKYLINIY